MAKQFLDENGVKQLWGKCKDKFASKGTFPTIPQFKGTFGLQKPDGMTAIVNEYYGKCENGVLSVMANLVIEFTKADTIDYIAYDYGFYNKFKFSDISPYLVDAYGTRLNTNPTNDGVLVASQRFVAFPSDAASSVGRNETVNLVMVTGGVNYKNIAQLTMAFSPSYSVGVGRVMAFHATLSVPLWE